MKAALVVALFGALFAVSYGMCPEKAYHSCVKDEKPPKCTAVEVCEFPEKEPCGKSECEYPYVCASLKKEECIGFLALKEKCTKPQKVCKEIRKPCGTGSCGADHDCVKETVCTIKKVDYGRKMFKGGKGGAKAVATSNAFAAGGDAVAIADAQAAAFGSDAIAIAESSAIAVAGGFFEGEKYVPMTYDGCNSGCDKKCMDGWCDEEKLVCEDTFTCVAKEPCVDIVVKKCVKSEYKPGIDICDGQFDFLWHMLNDGEKCGEEYCGYGYDCAEVTIQKCKTECGHSECGYGYECVTEYEDVECEKYAYLKTICKDVYEPICVKLPPFIIAKYKPPCKTVFKCEEEDCICGNEYCPYGFVCAVEYKKTCGGSHKKHHGKFQEKPTPLPEPKKDIPVIVSGEPSESTASADLALAAEEGVGTAAALGVKATGDGVAVGDGDAATDNSLSAVQAAAGQGQAGAGGVVKASGGETALGKVSAEYDE